MDKSVVVLITEIDSNTPGHPPDEPAGPDAPFTPAELVLTYNGTSLTATIDGHPHAQGFECHITEASDLFDHPVSACVLHVPDLGHIPLTRRQATDMNRKMLRLDERLTSTAAPRGPGRPPIDADGTKQITLTLPGHTVEMLDTWAAQAGIKRGVHLRDLVVSEVEHRTITELEPDLIDNPGWQERAVDAWIEGAEERGFGFHVVRTMLDQTEEIALVRRDNWDNPVDATVGGREYLLTAHWPQGLDPADYGQGTSQVIIMAQERPRRSVVYRRGHGTSGPVIPDDQRAAIRQAAQAQGWQVIDPT